MFSDTKRETSPALGDLFIFGYGSLIYKQNFDFVEAAPAYIKGFKRLFYQGSTDHRGVPGKPGRVVTLLKSNNNDDRVHGLCFRIAKEKIPTVLAALDIREKGGYDRHMITAYHHHHHHHHHDAEGNNETEKMGRRATEESVLSDACLCYIANEHNEEYLGPGPMEEMAKQIATSSGPSGPNVEYLFKLAEGLRKLSAPDDHVFELEALIKKMME